MGLTSKAASVMSPAIPAVMASRNSTLPSRAPLGKTALRLPATHACGKGTPLSGGDVTTAAAHVRSSAQFHKVTLAWALNL